MLGGLPRVGEHLTLFSSEVVDDEVLGDRGEVRPERTEPVVALPRALRECPSEHLLNPVLELEAGSGAVVAAVPASGPKPKAAAHQPGHRVDVLAIDLSQRLRSPSPEPIQEISVVFEAHGERAGVRCHLDPWRNEIVFFCSRP